MIAVMWLWVTQRGRARAGRGDGRTLGWMGLQEWMTVCVLIACAVLAAVVVLVGHHG